MGVWNKITLLNGEWVLKESISRVVFLKRLGIVSIKRLFKSKLLLVSSVDQYLFKPFKENSNLNKNYFQHPVIQNNITLMPVNSMNVLGVLLSKIEMSSPLKWLCFIFCKFVLSFIFKYTSSGIHNFEVG